MAKRPTAAETAIMTDKDYLANWTIDNIDGTVLKQGDIVALEPETAAPFVKLGALSEVRTGSVQTASGDDEGGDEPPEGTIP